MPLFIAWFNGDRLQLCREGGGNPEKSNQSRQQIRWGSIVTVVFPAFANVTKPWPDLCAGAPWNILDAVFDSIGTAFDELRENMDLHYLRCILAWVWLTWENWLYCMTKDN